MIKSVKVKNFRVHSNREISFTDGINIITGNNGVGKTSIIEAIYISLVGRSWRSNLESIIKQGESWWRVDFHNEEEKRIVKYNNGKSFEIKSKKYFKLPKEFRYPVVLFEPDDLNLLYGSPSRRRHWLDNLIKDIDFEYGSILNKFEKVLRQRNFLLKNQASQDKLFVWDLQFADLASQIIKKRKKIINTLNKKVIEEYQKITSSQDELKIEYSFDNIKNKQDIINQLQKNYQSELATGNTSIGPQKNDILFYFNNKPASTSASRGENRSIILALKNIEYNIKKTKETLPLILLDDIMSELDETHQINLLKNFKESQVIITSVVLPKTKNKTNIIKI